MGFKVIGTLLGTLVISMAAQAKLTIMENGTRNEAILCSANVYMPTAGLNSSPVLKVYSLLGSDDKCSATSRDQLKVAKIEIKDYASAVLLLNEMRSTSQNLVLLTIIGGDSDASAEVTFSDLTKK